ncbi:MAG: IPT/TIG domain-containing protein, partial [Bacteroidota bacterium]|nr:IPT/TIG domain-containing protein [Candidatus Kapabacteria bacterium]MDW8220705.1 IPT/TIG domain-containing protein [Bacteroidota bacterium]
AAPGSSLTLSSQLFIGANGAFNFTGNNNKLILANFNAIITSGTIQNQTPTQFFVTNGTGELRLNSLVNETFYVGPSTTVFSPITVINNGQPAAFSVRTPTTPTLTPPAATGNASLPQPAVNRQWNVRQVSNVVAGSLIALIPSWTPAQEAAGFNRAAAVVRTGAPANLASTPTPAATDPLFSGYFRSQLNVTQTAGNILTGTPVIVHSEPTPPTSFTFTPMAQSSGGTIRIIGTGFVAGAVVSLGGVNVPSANVTLRVGAPNNPDTLVVVVPPNAASGNVGVTQNGVTRTASGFTFLGAPPQQPIIRDVLPAQVPAGLGDVVITINGAAFGVMNPRVVAVGNGITATITPITSSVTSITISVPAEIVRNPGTLQLTVTSTERLPVSTSVTIIAAPALSLNSITPSSTTGNLSPFVIAVTGRNFSAQSSFVLSDVRLTVLSVTQNSDGTITARLLVPAGVVTGNLTVTNVNGQSASLPFQVNNLTRPTITSVNPPIIPPGSPNTVITIRGRNVLPGFTVFFAGQQLSGAVLTGDSVITVTIPASLLTQEDLAVLTIVNPDLQSIGYRLPISNAAPGAVSLDLTAGLVPNTTTATGSAFLITLNGVGFAGQPRVFVGGQQITLVSTSATRLTAIVPGSLNAASNVPVMYPVQVINPNGVSSNALMLTILPNTTLPPPAIVRITPASPAQAGVATVITIIGQNFSTNATVRLGTTQLTVSSRTATQLVATIPATVPAGTYTLSVTNPDGQFASQPYVLTSAATGVSSDPVAGFRVYPNPAVEQVTVQANVERAGKLVITVTNALGQRVLVEEHNAAVGFFSRMLNLRALPAGSYMVEVTDGVRRSVEKIVKN